MGRGTRADGAIVLAYRQGGADGPVRAESRELTRGSDRGLLAPPLCPTLSSFFAAAWRRGRRGATRACFSAGDGQRGRLGRGDGEEAQQQRTFTGNKPELFGSSLSSNFASFSHLSRCPPPGAAGRSYSPTMPAAPFHNHTRPSAHPNHTS